PDNVAYLRVVTDNNHAVIKRVTPDGNLSSPIAGDPASTSDCSDFDGSGGVRNTLCGRSDQMLVGPDGQLYVLMPLKFIPGIPNAVRRSIHVVRPDGKLAEVFPGLNMDIVRFRIAADGSFVLSARTLNPNPDGLFPQYWLPEKLYRLKSAYPGTSDAGYK